MKWRRSRGRSTRWRHDWSMTVSSVVTKRSLKCLNRFQTVQNIQRSDDKLSRNSSATMSSEVERKITKTKTDTRGRTSSGTKAARPNRVSVRPEKTRSSSWKSCSHKSETWDVTRDQLSKWRCHRGSSRSIRVKLRGQSPSKSMTKETLKSTLCTEKEARIDDWQVL